MLLDSLFLWNFRLYRQASVSLAPGVNIVLGENAQGKTSLLEAVAFLIIGRGLAGLGQLIHGEEHRAQIEAVLTGEGRQVKLKAVLTRGRQAHHLVDGVPTRLAEVYHFFPIVPYWPLDTELVRGEPEVRRRFLDGMLVRLSSAYLADWRRYRRALSQRNACLRRGCQAALEVWEEELARYGGRLVGERQRALHLLARFAGEIYLRLTGGGESLSLTYVAPWLGEKENGDVHRRLLEALRQGRSRDLRFGHTLVGPHRDDIGVLLDGREVRGRASRGQQKDAALALRLAQAALVAAILGREPLLLLDDVFAELDAKRREWLGSVLKERNQVLITATEAGLLPRTLAGAPSFIVAGGEIRPA